jgi:vancomycin resistance protein YoaR
MKKTTLALMTMVSMMLATTVVSAAPAVTTAAPAPAKAPVTSTVPATTTPTTTTTTAATTTASAQDMVKVNGVEMTREQARLVILANVRNHTQMTAEEMVAYVNKLEADANAAQAVKDGTLQPNVAPAQAFNQ